MRKIEEQMVRAIAQEKNWAGANTSVINEDGVSYVYLHGNKIAEVGETWLTLFDGGWRTSTTKSRLNAILRAHGNGDGIYQRNFEWFLSTAKGDIPFISGMKLE